VLSCPWAFLRRDIPRAIVRNQFAWGMPPPLPCPTQNCYNSTTANPRAASPVLLYWIQINREYRIEGKAHGQESTVRTYQHRGTRPGNDRLRTRGQGRSFGARRLVAAFARRDSSRRTSAPVTSHRRQKAGASSRTPKATPPIRAPALDGPAQAAPYPGPDDEPRRRPKYVHLCATRSSSGSRPTAGGDEDNLHLAA